MEPAPPKPSDVLESFYREFFEQAFRWALALVGDRAEAEDIAQEVTVRVGSRADTLKEPAAYLRRSVVNACRNWHRDSARRASRQLRVAVSLDVQVPSIGTVDVLEALAKLPFRQRAAVVLRTWLDWTDEDIAEAIGCRPSTVRVLIHRGLKALRRELS